MENSKCKSRKIRKIQMKYPAPYSQSWSTTEPVKKHGKMQKSTSFQGNQYECCRLRPKPLKEGCNPFAPHLKYGLFPRKVTRVTNNEMLKRQPEVGHLNTNKKRMTRDTKKMKEGQPSPQLVIRSIDKLSRRLSSSGINHIDIQPRNLTDKKKRHDNYIYKKNQAFY
ncbi:uncharacterized protein LOC116778533 isoform X1 [Danaus plexippus]|uniref:uncharacterized protein LOC116778533 isoform X1 n=1 Tax=Danaus plexippus TaxID=13037 RepID=UPI002AB13D61|nr:uncharacterized protein LOC116778533 isoform X1 [Danaus plexippus]